MSKKLTDEEIVLRCLSSKPNYKILKIERVNIKGRNRIKLEVECDKGHIYNVLFENLIKEYGGECPICRKQKISEQKSIYVYKDVKEKLLESNLILLTKEDEDWKYQIECKCLLCNSIKKMNITAFMRGRACGCVVNNKKRTQEEFEKMFYNIHDKEEYQIIGEYINNRTNIGVLHKKCNNITHNSPDNLLRRGQGCPYCASSKGESQILKFLQESEIEFVSQKKFKNLVGVNEGLLSYDFFLPKYNLLIEFQGQQHEFPIDIFGGQESFVIQMEHDKRKKEYANYNDFKLLEIWYYEFDFIEQILKKELKL